VSDQHFGHIELAGHGGIVQRRFPLVVASINLGTALDEDLGDFGIRCVV
jgi:hypothetical protein